MILSGQFCLTVSGNQSYDIADADANMVLPLVDLATKLFGFSSRLPVFGPDGMFVDCKRGKITITIGWDIWSGCFVMGHSPQADEYVREMGEYLDRMIAGGHSDAES